MGLLVLAACSGPPRGDSGEFAVVPIVFDGKALGAEATLRYDAGRLEFMGVSSDNPDVLVAAHASLDSVAEGSVAEGSVSVALATVAEPVQGRLAQASFRVKAPGGEVTLTDLRVIDAARGEVAPGTEAAPALLNVNPAAGYDLAARASALDAHLRAQAVSSQPVLDASFADFPLGDLDRSGRVTLEDVVAIAAIAKGKDASPTDYQLYHSDLNGNGVVNSSDVAAALFKVVDRKLEAELQVAPRVLNLDLGDSGLILLGNAGNRPLPDVTVTSPPGVSVSEISHEGAVGRVFQAEASAVTASGAIVFDAGLAGTQVVALNAAFDPALCEAYEPNDAREEAAPIEPGTILAAICPEFDVDWYSLTLETSQLLSLELGIPTGSSLNQVYGTLYDAQGNPVGSVSIFDDPFGGGYGQTFAMYVPAGSYTLELSGFSFFGGDPLSAVYSLDFSAEEPSVPAIFEASAGTANISSPFGIFDATLIALSARQGDDTPLPYDVLVYIDAPGRDPFPFTYHASYGPVYYDIFDPEGGPAPIPPPPGPDPIEPPPGPDPEPTGQGARETSWFDMLVRPRGLSLEGLNNGATSPAAILGGTFRFVFPDVVIERHVDPGQKLELPANATATLSDDRASVLVSFEPVPGALEYTVVVNTSQGPVFAISDGPNVTVPLEHPVSEWETLFIGIIAADFTGFIDPVAEGFGLPIPEEQINISATVLELTFERPTVIVQPGESIQAALDAAGPGSQISIAPGLYREAVTIDKPGIRILGLGGFEPRGEEIVLENPGGEANGVTVTTDGGGVEIVNLTIRDFAENGIFLEEVDGFLISGVAAHNNGEYGFYPIRSSNGVIENCTASGHSDAGVYVGRRSHDITIQNCVTFENVTGIEITNSSFIQAYGNESFNNAAGFLVALLPGFPDAPPISVSNIWLSGNHVHDNNLPNFADHGLEQFIPSGSGMLIIGIDDSIIEYNTVTGNQFVGIGVGNTGLLAELAGTPVGDIEPFPDRVRVIGNTATGNGGTQPIDFLPPAASVDLLWDGTGTGNCWSGNDFGSSLNLDLAGGSPSPALPACD